MKTHIKNNIGEHHSLKSFDHDELEYLTKKTEEKLKKKQEITSHADLDKRI